MAFLQNVSNWLLGDYKVRTTKLGDNSLVQHVQTVDASGNYVDAGSIASLTTVGNNKKTVTTAGTRVQLATTTTVKSVTIKALATNTGKIYVGSSTVASTNGYELSAGDSITLDIADLASIYLDSSVNAESVTYIYLV